VVTRFLKKFYLAVVFVFLYAPLLAIEYIAIDRVDIPEPVVKKLITKSSNESVNARRKPVTIPGRISGIITLPIA
jgi:ABC-type spermidine/putrescine transport system permease subunit II